MSEGLRKKLKLATALAPSLLDQKSLWSTLEAAVERWGHANLPETVSIAGAQLRKVSSQDVLARVSEFQKTFFRGRESPVLAAVAFDDVAVRLIAGNRLGGDSQSAEEAPHLLTRLLAEQAAVQLWQTLSSHPVIGGDDSCNMTNAEPADVAGGFGPEARYILADYPVSLNGQHALVRLVFEAGAFADRALGMVQPVQATQRQMEHRTMLRDSIRSSGIRLNAVLETMGMTIGDCARLEIGDTIEMPGVDLARLSLCTETTNGQIRICDAELGTWKQHRAVRVNGPVSEGFARKVWENQ